MVGALETESTPCALTTKSIHPKCLSLAMGSARNPMGISREEPVDETHLV